MMLLFVARTITSGTRFFDGRRDDAKGGQGTL
jgi:hypothetical protein